MDTTTLLAICFFLYAICSLVRTLFQREDFDRLQSELNSVRREYEERIADLEAEARVAAQHDIRLRERIDDRTRELSKLIYRVDDRLTEAAGLFSQFQTLLRNPPVEPNSSDSDFQDWIDFIAEGGAE